MKYHKQSDGTISYCYQCYKQRRIGSSQTRMKKELDASESCNISIVQEWKLVLMANVIFDVIWNDKGRIIDMANQLIDESIKDDDFQNEHLKELEENKNKILTYEKKKRNLIDMYLNDLIDKENYKTKKDELDQVINDYLKKTKNWNQNKLYRKLHLKRNY